MNDYSFIIVNEHSPGIKTLMSAKQDVIQAQLIAVRRNQILDAATQTFAQRGYHNSTIRQIAAEAGVADGTIYIYFKNKTDLLLGLLNRLNESEARATDLEQLLHGDMRTRFTSYMRQRLRVVESNLQTFRAILPEILADEELRALYRTQVIEPTFALAEPFIEQAMAQGIIRPIPVAFLLRTIAGMVLGLLVLRLLGESTVKGQWQQLPELLSDLLFVGMEQREK
jgi:TetR/AcrR family fatty acid metabolism transcriptional regulator